MRLSTIPVWKYPELNFNAEERKGLRRGRREGTTGLQKSGWFVLGCKILSVPINYY